MGRSATGIYIYFTLNLFITHQNKMYNVNTAIAETANFHTQKDASSLHALLKAMTLYFCTSVRLLQFSNYLQ